jgi:hypothetical protein
MLDPKRYLGRDQPRPSATLGSPSRCSAIFTSSLLVCMLHHLCSSHLLRLSPIGVVEWFVDLPAHPQAVQEHGELPSHGHHRPLLGVLATPGGYLLSVAPQVRIGAEGSQDVVGAAHQELPQHLLALLGDALLTRIPLPRPIAGWHEPQISTYAAAPFEAVGVLYGQHERERRKRTDPLDLAQELRFWVMLFRDRFQLSLVVADTLRKGADRLKDGS